jgi:hypothetical protein
MTTIRDGSANQIYHALDNLTAAIIELQQLQRRLGGAQPPNMPDIGQSLRSIEEHLRDLSVSLTGLRDQEQPEI